jgi:SHS2 domain-containing protein
MKQAEYEFLPHTADLRFRAYGKSLDECFQNAAKALSSSIADPQTLAGDFSEEINLEADDLGRLLHDFLSEIIFRFETETLLIKETEVAIKDKMGYSLRAQLSGELYNPDKHRVKAEIKAVTYHELKVAKVGDVWTAEVLCDI